jgi:hypothetical protein
MTRTLLKGDPAAMEHNLGAIRAGIERNSDVSDDPWPTLRPPRIPNARVSLLSALDTFFGRLDFEHDHHLP